MNSRVLAENKPNIYMYDDYREFLHDTYTYLKKLDSKKYTFRTISAAAGFKSASFLKHVIDGERNLTQASIFTLSKALGLSRKESAYFEKLVQFSQAKNIDEKSERVRALIRSRDFSKLHPLSEVQFNYYSKWYYVVIREMVTLANFVNDPFWISQSLVPNISEAEAKQAIEELLHLGLIQQAGDGKLSVTSTQVKTDQKQIAKAIAKSFHKQMLERAGEALDIFPSEQRQFSAMTLGVSRSQYEMIKKEIDRLTDYILSLAKNNDSTEEVIQFNCQVFPVVNSKRFQKPEGDEE